MLCHAAGVKGEAASGSNREGESTDAERRGGAARSGVEGPVMGLERRGCVVRPWPLANWKQEELVDEAKPFKIPKREVWEAFKHVKANQGAAGVDGQSIAGFEANLSGNLYKLWEIRRPASVPMPSMIASRWLPVVWPRRRTRSRHGEISGKLMAMMFSS